MKPSKDLDEQIDEILERVFSQGVRAGKDIALEKYEDYNAWKRGDEKQQLLAIIEQTKKSYGGCEKCYGKGYATVSSRWTAYDTDTDIGSPGGRYSGGEDFKMKFCDCERGVQLGKLIEQREREARIDGRRAQAEATFDKWHSVNKIEDFGIFAEGQKLTWQYEALHAGKYH